MRITTSLVAFMTAVSISSAQVRLYVDDSAPAGGNGSSWATAFASLDDALSVAVPGVQTRIWVAEGVYRPSIPSNPADPRTASFEPVTGVRLLGGFDGTETTIGQRAGLFSTTILSGDIGQPGVRSDNAYSVVRLVGNGANHTVDGFVIESGNADGPPGSASARLGGGIYSQLGLKRIRNCTFRFNQAALGGAISTEQSIFLMRDCTLRQNVSLVNGGAAHISGPFYSNSNRYDRNRTYGRGGALHIDQVSRDGIDNKASARFQNDIFTGNIANNGGAAFVTDPAGVIAAGAATFTNCTMVGNRASGTGGAIGTNVLPSQLLFVQVENSILWGNVASTGVTLSGDTSHYEIVEYSIVQQGWPGTGVINAAPLFVNGAAGDFRLSAGSPAIDAGDSSAIQRDFHDLDNDNDFFEATPFDFEGDRRRADDANTPDTGVGASPVVDMGSFEFN